jgi:hypothetical protein
MGSREGEAIGAIRDALGSTALVMPVMLGFALVRHRQRLRPRPSINVKVNWRKPLARDAVHRRVGGIRVDETVHRVATRNWIPVVVGGVDREA